MNNNFTEELRIFWNGTDLSATCSAGTAAFFCKDFGARMNFGGAAGKGRAHMDFCNAVGSGLACADFCAAGMADFYGSGAQDFSRSGCMSTAILTAPKPLQDKALSKGGGG